MEITLYLHQVSLLGDAEGVIFCAAAAAECATSVADIDNATDRNSMTGINLSFSMFLDVIKCELG